MFASKQSASNFKWALEVGLETSKHVRKYLENEKVQRKSQREDKISSSVYKFLLFSKSYVKADYFLE